jgi:type IV secretory pathway TrbD component
MMALQASQFAAVLAELLDDPILIAGQMLGLAMLAGTLAGIIALGYRWYARNRVQSGLPVLVGLSAIAVYLNTTTALGQVIAGPSAPGAVDPISTGAALFNIAAFLAGTAGGVSGVRIGDRLGAAIFAANGARNIEGEVSRMVEAVGRVIAVEFPEEIDDIVGYDPVPDDTKEQLAERTFLFPRRLTVSQLESRLKTRLKTDFGVGHVDIELAADGSVEYLALGARAAGLGPTLPPETAAVAIKADPAFAASAGDVVRVRTPETGTHVATAELRGTAGDVVTLAVDAADAPSLDTQTNYRLVTLPVESRPDREFASLLRGAEETMGFVEVEDGSSLVGQPVGSLDVTVVAVRAAGEGMEPIPRRDRVLEPGDAVYVVARPDALRKLESSAAATE